VVVETTGLADPAPVLQSLMAHPAIVAAYRLDGVVTLVDAVNGAATLDAHEEAKRMLEARRDLLEQLANALLERETLDAEEVDAIVSGRELPQRQKVVIPTYAEREKAAAAAQAKALAEQASGEPAPAAMVATATAAEAAAEAAAESAAEQALSAARKQAEDDVKLLANRIALLKMEEQKVSSHFPTEREILT
jgi:G3E family GTPase